MHVFHYIRRRDDVIDRRRLAEVKQRYQEGMEQRFAPKPSYALFGAVGGIVLGLFALIVSHGLYHAAQGALLLAAGALSGAVVGLDLHSTRTWRRFGKYTLPIRFILACSAGGTATGFAGTLLGLVARADMWRYTGGGAVVGLMILAWLKLAEEH